MLFGSMLAVCGLIFFELGSVVSIVSAVGGIGACMYGGYMMTRGFTKVDVDHPDYAKWKERMDRIEEQRANRQ